MLFSIVFADLSCLNAKQKPVDWFVMLKQNNGYNAIYADAAAYSAFTSVTNMNDASNPAVATLKQVWSKKGPQTVIFNDEAVGQESSTKYAHQKGVLAFDKASMTGFYLMHTTPGWPGKQGEGNLTYDAITYAQDFFCYNIDAAGLNEIAKALYVSRPQIYSNTFQETFLQTTSPVLQQVMAGAYEKTSNATASTIKTRGGQKLDFYYKNKQWDKDMWAQLIAPTRKVGFTVETWLRDAKAAPYCTGYQVQMAEYVSFGGDFAWKESQDHSKWGVSTTGNYVCFADINFQDSQRQRGGTALCLANASLAKLFLKAVVNLDPNMSCPK